MEPASTIIAALGGAAVVAEITGAHRTRVYKWQDSKEKGGTGGSIPQKHIPALIAAAHRNGVDLDANDFFPKLKKEESAAQ